MLGSSYLVRPARRTLPSLLRVTGAAHGSSLQGMSGTLEGKVAQNSVCSSSMMQRRWYDNSLNKKTGLAVLVSGKGQGHVTDYCFVARNIPVVMLKTVKGVGKQGQIVFVKRGYARHHLVPKKLAVYGSLWENVDQYADWSLMDDPSRGGMVIEERFEKQPFDWIADIKLRFVETTEEDTSPKLTKPVKAANILEELSEHHALDLLEANLTIPPGGYTSTGSYRLPIQVPFKGSVGTYDIDVEIVSEAAIALEEQRRLEEEAEAAAKKPSFTLDKKILKTYILERNDAKIIKIHAVQFPKSSF